MLLRTVEALEYPLQDYSRNLFAVHFVGGLARRDRFRANREPLERFEGVLSEGRHNLALTVLCVPSSLESGPSITRFLFLSGFPGAASRGFGGASIAGCRQVSLTPKV